VKWRCGIVIINEYLKNLRKARGFTQRGLALKMGVSNSTISQIENGRNKPSIDLLFSYARALNGDISAMIAIMQNESKDHKYTKDDLVEVDMSLYVPLVGSVRAGQPILTEQNIEEYLLFDRRKLNPESIYFALRIVGDSMDKLFREGDIVLVEKMEMVSNGQIAVVGINGYEATVKRVNIGDGNIALIPESNNPVHIPKVYSLEDEEIHIIGRVIQSTRFF
jgi:repressor LexA